MDRAALDVALRLGIPCGGWCPRGRLAEDGVISAHYPLHETPLDDPAQRTEWNVRDADATLVLFRGPPSAGTAFTIECAARLERPLLVVDLLDTQKSEKIRPWLDRFTDGGVLNVAGPRESQAPGIYADAVRILEALLRDRVPLT